MNTIFLEIMPSILLMLLLVLLILVDIAVRNKDRTPIQELQRKEFQIDFSNKFNSIQKIFYYILVGGYVVVLLLAILVIFTYKHEAFFLKLIESIGGINNICIGITSVVITISVIVLTIRKDYYLVFTVNDVLQTRHFETGISFVISTCLLSQLLTVILFGLDTNNIYYIFIVAMEEFIIVVNYGSSIFVLFIIFRVLFSRGYFELSILKQLYRKLWNFNTLLSNIYQKWDKYAINVNLAYLVQDYDKAVNKVDIKNIEELQFVTMIGEGGLKWYNKAVGRIFKACTIPIIFSSIISISVGNTYLIFLNLSIIFFILSIFNNEAFIYKYYKYLNKLIYDSWGYYIKMNNKEYFCGIVSIFPPRKIKSYIHSIKNIVCFAYIGIEVKFENNDDKSVIEYILNRLQLALDNKKCTSNLPRAIYLIPIFLIGYLLHHEKIEDNCIIKIKDVYKNLKLDNNEKLKLNETLYGLSLDISRDLSNRVINKEYCDYWRYLNTK